ncbi:MAG: hypothetical protein V3581_04530, partial [Candidatus Cardinium sp.]
LLSDPKNIKRAIFGNKLINFVMRSKELDPFKSLLEYFIKRSSTHQPFYSNQVRYGKRSRRYLAKDY